MGNNPYRYLGHLLRKKMTFRDALRHIETLHKTRRGARSLKNQKLIENVLELISDSNSKTWLSAKRYRYRIISYYCNKLLREKITASSEFYKPGMFAGKIFQEPIGHHRNRKSSFTDNPNYWVLNIPISPEL